MGTKEVDISIGDLNRRTEEFKRLTIKHPLQEQAKNRAMFQIEHGADFGLVLITGPSGVGKTTLLELVRDAFNNRHAERMREEPDFVPIICTEAVADGYRRFDWRRFYRDALIALGDVFADRRCQGFPRRLTDGGVDLFGEGESTRGLRFALEYEMQRRRSLVWLVDEAQHIVMGGTSGQPGDQFDVLKSIAKLTGVTIVLCGTNQLLQYVTSSAQLARRSYVVPFPQYRWDVITERTMFARVASTLFAKLGVTAHPNVHEREQTLYLGSLGCVGVLKDWIGRAFARALERGSASLELEDLLETRHSQRTLRSMLDDIRAAELGDADLEDDFIEAALGRKRHSQPMSNRASELAERAHRRLKPGVRKPSRDPVAARRAE